LSKAKDPLVPKTHTNHTVIQSKAKNLLMRALQDLLSKPKPHLVILNSFQDLEWLMPKNAIFANWIWFEHISLATMGSGFGFLEQSLTTANLRDQ
jgi:hypothetical protein